MDEVSASDLSYGFEVDGAVCWVEWRSSGCGYVPILSLVGRLVGRLVVYRTDPMTPPQLA